MKFIVERQGRERTIEIEPRGTGYAVRLEGQELEIEGRIGSEMRVLLDGRPIEASVRREGPEVKVTLRGRTYAFQVRDARVPKLVRKSGGDARSRGELHAPMPGLVVEVLAKVGDQVDAGRPLVVVEAMKMQNAFVAPLSGRVTRVDVKAGMPVESGQLLVMVAPGESS